MYELFHYGLLGVMLVVTLGVFVRLPFLWNSRKAALGLLLVLIVVGIPVVNLLRTDQDKAKAAQAEAAKHDTYDDVYAKPETYLEFDARPAKECGGLCLVLAGSVRNTSSYAIKDPKIRCDVNGESGKRLDRKEITLAKRISANTTIRFSDLKLGLIDQQASGANCSITDADIAQGELPERISAARN